MIPIPVTNAEIDSEEKKEAELKAETKRLAEQAREEGVKISLASHVRSAFEGAKNEKRSIQDKMIENLLQKKGEYDAVKLAQIRELGSEIFMMITDVKCRTALAMLHEIYNRPGERPFSIEPTPVPKLTPEVEKLAEELFMGELENFISQLQEVPPQMMLQIMREALPKFKKEFKAIKMDIAKEKASAVESKIDDQLTEGGFYRAVNESLADLVDLKAAFIKGPIYRQKKVVELKENPDKPGKAKKMVTTEIRPEWDAPSPFDIFPLPGVTDINKGGLIELLRYKRSDLQDMIGLDAGFDEVAIREVLEAFQTKGLHQWTWDADEIQRAEAEGRDTSQYYDWQTIDALEYHDDIPARFIMEWGGYQLEEGKKTFKFQGHDLDPDFDYPVVVLQIDRWTLKIAINENPLSKKPYFKASYIEQKGAFWGRGLPETIPDGQALANSVIRALQNNVALASGPQIGLDKESLAPGQDDSRMWPWKIWRFVRQAFSSQTQPFMQFFQPQMHVQELVVAYDKASKICDEHSGIAGFTHGDRNIGGAGNALANYEYILTPKGERRMELIKVGDAVVNTYGSFSHVTGVYPQGETDIFRMFFSNGEYIDCDLNHRWSVRSHHGRKFQTLTTEEILMKGLFRRTRAKDKWRNPKEWRSKWMLPIIDAVEFEEQPIDIDPYTMGALLGDGDSRCRLKNMDEEIWNRIPYPLGKITHPKNNKAWSRAIKTIRSHYRGYGLNCKSIEKFIPFEYRYNSRLVRFELLRGLMDTDGCCSKAGEVFFSTASYRLAVDFKALVRSLGGIVSSICREPEKDFVIHGRKRHSKEKFRVVFNLPNEKIFHLSRKQSRVRVLPKTHTYITGIKYIGRYKATCISVDSKDKLFVCTNFIPTHNTLGGFSMFAGMQDRGIKDVAMVYDEKVLAPAIEALYYENYDLDDALEYIGDVKIKAKGSAWLLTKQTQAVRLNDFSRMVASSPIFQNLMGEEGGRYLLTETAKSLNLEGRKLVPDKDFIKPIPGAGPTAPAPNQTNIDQAGNKAQGVENLVAPPQGG